MHIKVKWEHFAVTSAKKVAIFEASLKLVEEITTYSMDQTFYKKKDTVNKNKKPVDFELSCSIHICYAFDKLYLFFSHLWPFMHSLFGRQTSFFLILIYAYNLCNCTHVYIYSKYRCPSSVTWQLQVFYICKPYFSFTSLIP